MQNKRAEYAPGIAKLFCSSCKLGSILSIEREGCELCDNNCLLCDWANSTFSYNLNTS